MARYTIEGSTLSDIAAAIREKSGKTETMTPAEMATAISAIETGGGGDSGAIDAIIDRTITKIESNVSKVEDHVFYTCRLLESAIFPNATICGDNSFRDCNRLATAVFPNVEELQGGSFRGCSFLEYIDLPKATRMYASVFQGCSKLKTVILRKNAVCNISNVNAFTDTPIAGGTGFVYVPSALVEKYKSATNWSNYADQIRAIEDYPEITGG